ncbi:MAG TPA: hypothetical protein VEI57_03335 [Nitrospirota bacterium]|nr:hypothetical protein [Nitrospirota bacterium]
MKTHNFIRAMAWSALWVMLTGLTSCPLDRDKTPKIADLVYIPQQAPVDTGKTVAIIGTFDIIRESGETASIDTAVFDAQGNKVSSESFPLSDAALKTQSTLAFGFDMSTAKTGEYAFQLYIIDSKGKQSNKLDGTFAVTGLY